MRKLALALGISLVLSLAFGGVLVFAANSVTPGSPLNAIDRGLDAAITVLQDAVNGDEVQPGVVDGMDDTTVTPPPDEGEVITTEEPPEEGETTEGMKGGAYCGEGGDKSHPIMESLAQRHAAAGATYDGIKKLFCEDRLGFGEIDLAYRILAANPDAKIDLATILDKRLSGMGWGRIIKDLGLQKPSKDPKPGIGIGNGNAGGNAGGNGNAFGQNNNQGNGNPGGNGNAYGKTKNTNNGNKGGKGKP